MTLQQELRQLLETCADWPDYRIRPIVRLVKRLSQTTHKPVRWTVLDDGCWQCTSHELRKEGSTLSAPRIRYRGQRLLIYKYMYLTHCMAHIPHAEAERMVRTHVMKSLCHRIDCINPEHYQLTTEPLRTEGKLTPDQVRMVRKSPLDGKVLAHRLGVAPETIYRVRSGRHYTSIQ